MGGKCALSVKLTKEEEEQEEREIQEEIERKMRGMLNAEGKPYAPWMMDQIDLEASSRAIRARKRREREQGSAVDTGNVFDPQGKEASVGLKYRVINDRDVELGVSLINFYFTPDTPKTFRSFRRRRSMNLRLHVQGAIVLMLSPLVPHSGSQAKRGTTSGTSFSASGRTSPARNSRRWRLSRPSRP